MFKNNVNILKFEINMIINKCYSDFQMDKKYKQRICIEFCVKNGKTATETFSMLKVSFDD